MYKKIILVGQGCSEEFPSFIPTRLLSKTFPYSRMGETVEVFEKHLKGIKANTFNQTDIEKYKDGLYWFFGNGYSCFTYGDKNKKLIDYVLEEVDTERPWTIIRLPNGGEHLHYFTEDERYNLISEDIGYGEYK